MNAASADVALRSSTNCRVRLNRAARRCVGLLDLNDSRAAQRPTKRRHAADIAALEAAKAESDNAPASVNNLADTAYLGGRADPADRGAEPT